jgi:hypothetical protein
MNETDRNSIERCESIAVLVAEGHIFELEYGGAIEAPPL